MMPDNEEAGRLDVLQDARTGRGPVRRGEAVALFDPQGRYLGDGTMGLNQGDEIRIDVDRCDAGKVGFVIAGTTPDGELRIFIHRRPGAGRPPGGESIR